MRTLAAQYKEMDKFWNDLIYDVCKGDLRNMNELRKMDIFDFFDYIEHGRR